MSIFPKKNVDYQEFKLCQMVRQQGETLDQFVTGLWKVAATCEFGNVAKEIKLVVIQNCLSKRLRWYALREDTLTLDNLMAKEHTLEATKMEWKRNFSQKNLISFLRNCNQRLMLDNQESQHCGIPINVNNVDWCGYTM